MEVGATDAWQKIDNSSVLDGIGTGGNVAGWAGSGTSNTLTNSPITFSGDDVSIPRTGDVGVLNTTNLDNGSAVGFSLTYPTSNVAAGDGLAIAIGIAGRGRSYIANSNITNNLDASNLEFYTEGGGVINKVLTLDQSKNATFAGQVITNGYLTVTGSVTPQIFMTSTTAGTPNWTFIARNDGYFLLGRAGVSNDFYFDPSGNATFAGTIAVQGTGDSYFTGSVGIGVTGPSAKLEVSTTGYAVGKFTGNTDDGTGYVGAVIEIESNSNGRGRGVYLTHRDSTDTTDSEWYSGVPYTGDGYTIGNAAYGTSVNSDTGPAVLAQSRFFIQKDGNVGIGTTSPTGGALVVNIATTAAAADISAQATGTIAFSDNGANEPAIIGKSTANNTNGLYVVAAASDTNSDADFQLNVREDNNSDFSTLTTRAFDFTRWTTSLMTILRNGSVGIGVTGPSYKLEVGGNARVSSNFYIGNVDAVTTATEVLVRQSDRVRGITPANLINASGGPYLPLSAGSGYPLTGNLFINNGFTLSWGADTTKIAGNSSTNALSLITASTTRMRITSGGNVGIGTTSPSSFVSNGNKLVVGDGTVSQGITIYTSDDGNGTLYFADGTTGDEAYRGFVRYSHSLDSMLFYTAGANERMRIDSAGSTTITTDGTVDATTLTLTQTGGIVIDEALGYLNFYSNDPSTSSTGGVGGIAVRAETAFNTSFTPTYMSFYTHILTTNDGTVRGNVTERMRITSAGELQVTGNGVIRNEHSSANYSYWQQTASDARLFTQYAQPLYFGTNASTKMTILSGGNVGIGTTSPTNYRLDVGYGGVKGSSFSVEGASARIFAPSGATYNGSGAQTGYLILKLPDLGTTGINNMMTGVIRVFDYAGNESFDVHFAGYWYAGYNWTNCSAWIDSQANVDRNFTVRWGSFTGSAGAGTRPFISIGSATTTWSYVKFSVINFEPGHSNYQAYKWHSGWETDLSTTLPGSSLRDTSTTQSNNWARSGQDLYYGSGSGNVGIGVSPEATSKLHVKNTAAAAKITLETSNSYDSFINYSGASNEMSAGLDFSELKWTIGSGGDLTTALFTVKQSTGDTVSAGNLTLGDIANETTDTDKFLVSNAGLVKYITGTQMLSFIGAAPAGPGGVGYLPLSAGSSYPLTGDLYTGVYAINTRRANITSFNPGAGLVMNYGNSAGTVEFISLQSNGVTAPIKLQMRQSPNESDLILAGSSGTGLTLTSASNALFAGNVGIGTTVTTAGKLTVSSGGGANGSCVVVIEADTDNTVENSNPVLKLQQDGGGAFTHFGMNGNANVTYTGALTNAGYSRAATDFQIVAGSVTLAATFLSNGNVGIGTNAPSDLLTVQGAAKNISINNTTEDDAGIVFRDAQGPTDQVAAIKFNSGDQKLKFFCK